MICIETRAIPVCKQNSSNLIKMKLPKKYSQIIYINPFECVLTNATFLNNK